MITQLENGIFARTVQIKDQGWYLTTYLWVTRSMNLYIDAGLGEDAILELKSMSHPNLPDTVIYTHHHFDHIWGATALHFPRIIAHSAFVNHVEKICADQHTQANLKEGKNAVRWPNVWVSEDMDLDEDIRIIVAPGHTDDGLMVYHKTLGILFLGDLAADEGQTLPALDQPVKSYVNSLKKLQLLTITKILSSHRPPEESSYLNQLEENAYINMGNVQ